VNDLILQIARMQETRDRQERQERENAQRELRRFAFDH